MNDRCIGQYTIDRFFLGISSLISEQFMLLGIPSIGFILGTDLAKKLLLTFSFQLMLCNFIKNTCQIKRIPANNSLGLQENGFSFPSLHSAISVAIPLMINKYYKTSNRVRYGSIIASGGLIGYSRIHLGFHTWRDVIAGWIIGYIGHSKGEKWDLFDQYPYYKWISSMIFLLYYTYKPHIKATDFQPMIFSFKESVLAMSCSIGTLQVQYNLYENMINMMAFLIGLYMIKIGVDERQMVIQNLLKYSTLTYGTLFYLESL